MTVFELVQEAFDGLRARKLRAVLVALGPAIGVAAIVGIFGLSESARGDVRATLRELGTDLLVVDQASGSAGILPAESLDRIAGVSTVRSAAQTSVLSGIPVAVSRESEGTISLAQVVEVRLASPNLPEVLEVPIAGGRYLNAFDERDGVNAVVVGSDVAALFAIEPPYNRSILLNGELFGVVGVLEPSAILEELNNSVFITPAAARRHFGWSGQPSQIYIRVDGDAGASRDAVSLALTYGGGGFPLIRVPTDLLEASAAVDATFRAIVLGLGALSLVVGGIGIDNVMTISVIQRSQEVGIRRALGHTRMLVAMQFLLEAALIGVLGGLAGAVLGFAFLLAAVRYQDWVLVAPTDILLPAVALAVLVSLTAGVYPALRAARLEPLQALRSAG